MFKSVLSNISFVNYSVYVIEKVRSAETDLILSRENDSPGDDYLVTIRHGNDISTNSCRIVGKEIKCTISGLKPNIQYSVAVKSGGTALTRINEPDEGVVVTIGYCP